MHTHTAQQIDGELVCTTCGLVFDKTYQIEKPTQDDNFFAGLEKMMLPLTVSRTIGNKQNGFWADHFDRNIINYYRITDRLLLTVEQMGLPKYYAYETMRLLFKKNKHFWSYRGQLKTLLEVMQNTNDKRLARHIKVIQKRLNNAKGI